MLQRDNRRVAFAREKPVESVEQIFLDFAGQLFRSFFNSSSRAA